MGQCVGVMMQCDGAMCGCDHVVYGCDGAVCGCDMSCSPLAVSWTKMVGTLGGVTTRGVLLHPLTHLALAPDLVLVAPPTTPPPRADTGVVTEKTTADKRGKGLRTALRDRGLQRGPTPPVTERKGHRRFRSPHPV